MTCQNDDGIAFADSSFWKLHCMLMRKWELNEVDDVLVLLWKYFWLCEPLKGSWELPEGPRSFIKNHWLQ